MIIDRSHRKWFILTVSLAAAATWAYLTYGQSGPGESSGGSFVGMLFGIAASVLMLFCLLIPARKMLPRWRIGSAQSWLRAHIWLGLLSVPLTLFHAGFHLGGPLERVLLIVLAAIVASGVFGLVMQQVVTRALTTQVPLETFYDQTPHVCRMLQLEADVLVATLTGPLSAAPDPLVATKARLENLGVSGDDPAAKIYEQAAAESKSRGKAREAAIAPPPAAALPKKAEPAVAAAAAAPDEKRSSPADKIAMMRAAKVVAKPAAEPAVAEPVATAMSVEEPAKKALSPAEKIALMKAGKSTAPVAAAAPAAASAAKALSAAEKIALMKAGKKPAAAPVETPASDAPSTGASAAVVAEPTTESTSAPTETPATTDAPPKAISPAEKIALMRAGKATAKPTEAPAKPAVDAVVAAPAPSSEAKALSAAEKIALMKGAKKSADSSPTQTTKAEAEAAPAAAPPTVEPARIAMVARPKPALEASSYTSAANELKRFYLAEARPFLGPKRIAQHPLGNSSTAEGKFAAVRAALPAEWRDQVDALAALCEERRQVALQIRLYGWLHGWRAIHMPLSFVLLGLAIVHVVTALYW